MSKPLTFGSLFAGIGGLDLGLERAGMVCKWQVEIDGYATKVLEKHWPRVARWRDITTFPPDASGEQDNIQHKEPRRPGKQRRHSVDTRTKAARQANGKASADRTIRCGESWSVDLICGGFPCQDISTAGKRAGLHGDRSGLFFEAIRVVELLRPRWLLLENVAGLLARGLDEVLATLAEVGFDAEWHCLQAADFGAPHIRDRIFIIAHADRKRSAAGATDSPAREKGIQAIFDDYCSDITNANGDRTQRDQHQDRKRGRVAPRGQDGRERENEGVPEVSNTNSKRLPKRQGCKTTRTLPAVTRGTWWDTEPALGRVANGVPRRVDRLRCLGNAVVPQVAEVFGRYIVELNERT